MKKSFVLLIILFVSAFSVFGKDNSVIQNKAETRSVRLTGTWKTTDQYPNEFTMIFTEDGRFTYGCNKIGAPDFVYIGEDFDYVKSKYNQWFYEGTYKTSYDLVIVEPDKVKSSYRNFEVRVGVSEKFIVTIVDNNELIFQTVGTGSTRSYKRQ